MSASRWTSSIWPAFNSKGARSVSTATSRGPTGTFNFVRGKIQLAGNRNFGTDIAIADLFGTLPTITVGKGLTIEGAATVQTPVTIDGGTLTASSLAVSGNGALPVRWRHAGNHRRQHHWAIESWQFPPMASFASAAFRQCESPDSPAPPSRLPADLTLGDSSLPNGFYSNGTIDVGHNAVTLIRLKRRRF